MGAAARNLAIVDAHIRDETRDAALVMDLYTDDIVLEMPTRGLIFTSKAAIEANDRAMSGALAEVGITPGTRFATTDHVVDDCTTRFRLVGGGFANAPLPVGSRVECACCTSSPCATGASRGKRSMMAGGASAGAASVRLGSRNRFQLPAFMSIVTRSGGSA